MSFICKTCGPVKNGERKQSIPIKIRSVDYNLQIKTIYADREMVKTVKRTKGTEIVEEEHYCKKHLPKEYKPIVVGKVVRNQLIKTVLKVWANMKEDE